MIIFLLLIRGFEQQKFDGKGCDSAAAICCDEDICAYHVFMLQNQMQKVNINLYDYNYRFFIIKRYLSCCFGLLLFQRVNLVLQFIHLTLLLLQHTA